MLVGDELWCGSGNPGWRSSQVSNQRFMFCKLGCIKFSRNTLSANRKAWISALLGSLFFLLSTTNVFGIIGDIKNDPVKVIEKYLSLDKRGARLEARTSEVLKPYVAWGKEPAWGQVVVISDYVVTQDVSQWEIFSYLETAIPVTFKVLGFMQLETVTFLPNPSIEKLSVQIRAMENRWRIVGPLFPPHVGRKRLINFVRQALLNETNEIRIKKLQRLKKLLEDAR